MRWRPFTWLLLSLLFFVSAAFFWRLGNKWAAEKSALGSSQSTNQTPSLKTGAKPTAQITPFRLTTQPGSLNAISTASTNAERQNRFAYRLANTTQSLSNLIRAPHAIILENALFDTERPITLSIPDHLRAQGDPGSYIVQSRKSLDDAFRAMLKEAGAQIVSYIPNNAYHVVASGSMAQKMAADPQTQAVLPYEPYYKLQLSLLKLAVENKSLPQHAALNLLLFPDAREKTLPELKKLQAEIIQEDRSPFGPVLGVRVPADANTLPALAALKGVQLIEPLRTRTPANDLSRAAVGVSTNSVTTNNYLGLTGSNVLVNVNDTGIDAGHPDFAPGAGVRVLSDSVFGLFDTDGHGTHVAGIIAGSGAVSTNVNNAPGSTMPAVDGQFRGKAPTAKLFSIAFNLAAGPVVSDTYLQETVARTNGFISNNGWNYSSEESQGYDIVAASYDAAVRDALPRVVGSQPLLYVFSAGNVGHGDQSGTGGGEDTIQSPATAKNVITVGATELPRNITNEVVVDCITTNINGTNITICQTNTPWRVLTDSSDQIASFSSRGNVGVGIEGDSGRFKPDVVAPGAFVVSTRSRQWNERAYYRNSEIIFYRDVIVPVNDLPSTTIFVPENATELNFRVFPNIHSPVPFPGVPIFVSKTDFPTALPGGFDFLGTNQLNISTPALDPRDQVWFFGVGNSSTQTLRFDLRVEIVFSNANDAVYFQVLSNLNNSLETNRSAHYYRYESGTSMAAAGASGVLALMQDFLQNRLGHVNGAGRFTNSPALMKAMLINGARSAGNLYDFQTTNTINFQGWGLINLTNSLHGGLAAPGAITNSMFLFDQSPSNSLATGQSHTRKFQVSAAGEAQPMRVTLVWTDPPGSPIAATKLVNDLDLIVTNLDTGDVFFGNHILPGNDFNLPWDTNQPPTVDVINNVENVYLPATLDGNYSVTVVGKRVNVNAVTAHPDNVVQDYALVISSGDGALTNALSFTGKTEVSTTAPLVTVITNAFADNPDNFGGILTRQHAGANTPLLGTNQVAYPTDANAVITLGMTNQWHFYMFSNSTSFTNAAFATFAPPNLAPPVMGTRVGEEGTNATRFEADIDLYVTRDFRLTNLVPQAIDNASKSLAREGTESIILSNALPGVYYIGVKSEDQRSVEYSLAAIISQRPFSESDANGNLIVRGIPAPARIPDGAPDHPGAVTILGFSTSPALRLHRVIVTNIISHELMGDLFGSLTHQGHQSFAVLNNHSIDSAVTNAFFIYDDSSEQNVPGSQHTDGPGSLHDFAGKLSGQQWIFTMIDNAENHIGTNVGLHIFLEKQQDLTDGIVATINPGACREDFVIVPPDATNLTITVSLLSGTGPISLEVCPFSGTPDQCESIVINGGGGIITIDKNDVPPINGGEYLVRLCNLGTDPVTVRILAEISLGIGVPVSQEFALTNPVPIVDDFITTVTNSVASHFQISSLDVGLLINHPRISDLAITLISPNGTRILLFENRGALSTTGLGSFNVTTNGLGAATFAVTNMTPFYTNDFEDASVGLYMPSATFQDWSVLTNSVAVVRDLDDLCISNNVLVLGDGVISNSLPTTNSTSYRLSFKVTHSPYIVGMVGWWPLDDDATDIFGGLDGLLCGTPQFVGTGKVIGAFQGDGAGTSMMVPRCPDLDLGMGRGLTIEGWINPANITNAAPLVEWNDQESTNSIKEGVQFWLSGLQDTNGAPGTLWARLWDTNHLDAGFIFNTLPLSITNRGWQHVALTWEFFTPNVRVARIYTNGHLAATKARFGATPLATSGDLYFGFHPASIISRTAAFQGGLDEFSVYKRALCDCEIAAIADAGARGKYGTNVLICPVTNTVEITGILTTNFINGTNWFRTGPQWETNVIEFTNSLLSAITNGPGTNLAPIVIRPVGCPGAAIDEFILSSLMTNYFDGLLHFTDDTNLAPVPIKFAPAPYTVTNFPPVLIFSNGFENASQTTQRVQNAGAVLVGSSNNPTVGQRNWTVASGPIAVITNANGEAVGSNFLALATGAVETELPTIPGHRYQLTYSVRGPCAAGWWNGNVSPLDRRARDLIGGNNGAFINGANSSSFRFIGSDSLLFSGMISNGVNGSPDIASKIELGDPANLRFTNSFTIEGWIRPIPQTYAGTNEETQVQQIFFRGDLRHCLDPYYLALEQSSSTGYDLLFHVEDANSGDCGITLEAGGEPIVNNWQHVAAVFESNVPWTNNPPWSTNQLRLYLNGQRLTNLLLHPVEDAQVNGQTGRRPFRDLDPNYSPGVAIGNRSRGEASEPFRGFIDELTVYARALTDPEIAAIAAARSGKFDRAVAPALSLAKVSVQLDGDQKDVGYGDNSSWTVRTFTFTALRTNMVLRLQSLLPGTEVDTVTLTEIPSELNYQPEEPLSQLNGQDAFGDWRLEIWDNRAGASNNAPQLLDWQLTFHLLPETPPPVISLSHCIPYINTIPPNSIQYFVVDVPQWATMATNILGFANERFSTNPLNVSVLFNQTNFPTLADLPLIGPLASNGVSLMTTNTNGVPPLILGQPYFLAVTNPNPIAVNFSLAVCFDVVTLANCEPATNFLVGPAGIPRYFQFDVPTNFPAGLRPQEVTVWLTGANSNLTVVLSEHLPLPDLAHYDYISARPSTNDEVLLIVTNTTPFPIQTNRWYAGVFNSTATNVPFTITACYSTNSPTIIPLTNAVPYIAGLANPFVAPPGPPRWFFFEFSITNFVDALLFELYDLSGDADLVLQKDVPPGQWPYFDGSFRPGMEPEQIVVRSGYQLPDLRGNWFLGVYNNEPNNLTYTIRATIPTNGLLISALPLQVTLSPLAPPHGPLVQWNSVIGETYHIQFTPTLSPANWAVIATVVATTPCASYEIAPGLSGFFRIVQQLTLIPPAPILSLQFIPPNQVRLSWSTLFSGFTLQSAPSLSGPWTNVGLPVTVVGNEFVVFDSAGPSKYYRLFK